MLERIEYKDIKKYKLYIPFDLNSNSTLYFDKDLIHKIPYYKVKDFDNILSRINELSLNELIEIKKLIYKNNFIVGYSMKNYKEYKSLKKFKRRNFALKKVDCIRLVEAFKMLSNNNLEYIDTNLSNILLNKTTGDIKICDVDSLKFKDSKKLSSYELKQILKLILSYLYNVREKDMYNVLNSDGINFNNEYIKASCSNKCDITLDIIYKIIDTISLKDVVFERSFIIDKSKKLCDTGYYKYRR